MKKTKSARTKGLAFQRWIKDFLEERGWHVHNQAPCGRIITKRDRKTGKLIKFYTSIHNDIMGCDLIARKKGRLLWIQATLDTNIQRKLDELQLHFDALLEGESLQIWQKTKKGGEVNIKACRLENGEISAQDGGRIIRRKFYHLEVLK